MTIILDEIRSGYNLAKINYNFEIIEEALNGVLAIIKGDPGQPIEFEGPLDMNGYKIYNLGAPTQPNDAVRLEDLNAFLGVDDTATVRHYRYVATDGQTVFTLPTKYRQGVGQSIVYMDGIRLNSGYEFFETTDTTITLAEPAVEGQLVDIHVGVFIFTANDAAGVSYLPPMLPPTTVQAALDVLWQRDAEDVPLDSTGDGTNDTTVGDFLRSDAIGVPTGGIIMWSGSTANIPSGWVLCDGTAGTPDLRDRFIVGSGTKFTHASTGGSFDLPAHSTDYHTLTQAQLPSGGNLVIQAYSRGSGPDQSIPDGKDFSSITDGSRYHENAGHTGGASNVWQRDGVLEASLGGNDEGHNHNIGAIVDAIIPEYYALAFIMKV